MAIRQPEQGQRRKWSYRNGLGGFPGWRGVRRQGDQASIPVNQFWNAENVRLRGGNIVSRFGQSKVNTVALGPIDGLIDNDEDDSRYAILYCGSAGGNIASYTLEQSPAEQTEIATGPGFMGVSADLELESAAPRRAFHLYNGRLLAFSNAEGFVAIVNRFHRDGEATVELERLFAATGLNTGVVFQGKLWFGSTTGGDITYWDGQNYLTDTTGLGAGRVVLTSYRETLIAFGTQYAKIRSNTGSWTSLTMPVGTVNFRPLCWAIYNNVLYVGGHDDNGGGDDFMAILSYNGTTLALARSIDLVGNAVTTATEVGISDLTVFNGLLYYSQNWPAESMICQIGTYDGSTWTDAHKVFVSEVRVDDKALGAMIVYRGSLWTSFGKVVEKQLWQSPGTATSGTWVVRGAALLATNDMVLI